MICDNSIQYFCPSNEECNVSEEKISTMLEIHWNIYDQFIRRVFKICIVNLSKEEENWMYGCCTCPTFLKKFICLHINFFKIAILLKYIKPPPAVKQVPTCEKRSRRRPKLAARTRLVN